VMDRVPRNNGQRAAAEPKAWAAETRLAAA
jgi:hypothetical protein